MIYMESWFKDRETDARNNIAKFRVAQRAWVVTNARLLHLFARPTSTYYGWISVLKGLKNSVQKWPLYKFKEVLFSVIYLPAWEMTSSDDFIFSDIEFL